MRYHELFDIQLGHQYFPKGEFVELMIVPDKETFQRLKGQHFLIKGKQNGLSVLAETDEYKPVIFLKDTLTFEVYPTSAVFHTCTDTSELAPGEYWTFSNEFLLNDFQLPVSIAAGEIKSLNGFQMIAKIEIHPTDELLDLSIAKPYTITFNAVSAIWKYYLVTDPAAKDLIIEDKGSPALQFKMLDLQEDTLDPVGMALRANYPDAGLLLFESNTPVPRQSKGRKNIQLIRDGQTVIQHLPNPTAENQEIRIIKVLQ